MSWGSESSRPRPLCASQSRRLSGDVQSYKWFSPAITFSKPLTPIQGLEPASDVRAHAFSPPLAFPYLLSPTQIHQPLNDILPQGRFSPMMMSSPTPPFDFSRSQTPHLFRMSPPARPDRDSPAAAPSSMLEGLRGFSGSPRLFDRLL
jgi:hypothetical protein